jgi:phosphoribosylformylglycinamidine synthase
MRVKVLVLTGFGINADLELTEAFRMAGADPQRIHLNDLLAHPGMMKNYKILAFPGGFSFGDHLGSGLVLAHIIRNKLRAQMEQFIRADGLVIGICNGFQVLVKMGFLPNTEGNWVPEVSLVHNQSGRFQDEWVRLKVNRESPCIWTKGITEMEVPVRHGEGRFIFRDDDVKKRVSAQNLVTLTYEGGNPNGSELDTAGISSPDGRILGLMPHPEAFLCRENHPEWTRQKPVRNNGVKIFENAVNFFK